MFIYLFGYNDSAHLILSELQNYPRASIEGSSRIYGF